MALKTIMPAASPEKQLEIFHKILGETHHASIAAKALIDAGAKIETLLFVVRIVLPDGKTFSHPMGAGTTALINGTAPPQQKKEAAVLLQGLVAQATGTSPSTTQAKSEPTSLGQLLKQKIEQQKAQEVPASPPVQKTYEAEPSPDPKSKMNPDDLQACPVIKAQALGQKVFGASKNSIYKVVALSPSVKVAARISGYQMSVRVEVMNPSPAALSAIKAAFEWKTTYASRHLVCTASCPPFKTLGALLFSLPVKWTEIVAGADQLKEMYA